MKLSMNRASFLSAAPLAAAAFARARGAGVPGGSEFVERRANFDEAAFDRLVGGDADIKQVWEAVAFHPAIFNNVKNALNGLLYGFEYDPTRIKVVVAPHGPSSAYTYSDYIWQKYRIGDFFSIKDASGATIARNTFLQPARALDRNAVPDGPNSFYQDTSIATLQQRGVIFLTCHTAVEEQARALVQGGYAPAGMSSSDVADDMLTHLIDGTSVVPAMVAAIGVLQQRYHYSYITLTFA